ncbi:unnamed protein product [Arabidopsis halleri]
MNLVLNLTVFVCHLLGIRTCVPYQTWSNRCTSGGSKGCRRQSHLL